MREEGAVGREGYDKEEGHVAQTITVNCYII